MAPRREGTRPPHASGASGVSGEGGTLLPSITLARHGRTDAPLARWVGPEKARALIDGFDDRPVLPDWPPPDELVRRAGEAAVVFGSPAARSRASTELLLADRAPVIDPLYGEVPVVRPWLPFPLPLAAWIAVGRALWLARFPAAETPDSAARRAERAADRLIAAALTRGPVVLVGHGWLNHLIGGALTRKGWTSAPAADHRYWSHRTFLPVSRPDDPLAKPTARNNVLSGDNHIGGAP